MMSRICAVCDEPAIGNHNGDNYCHEHHPLRLGSVLRGRVIRVESTCGLTRSTRLVFEVQVTVPDVDKRRFGTHLAAMFMPGEMVDLTIVVHSDPPED